MRLLCSLFIAVALTLAVGCGKKSDDASQDDTEAKPVALTPDDLQVTDEDVPVPPEFEEEAEREITTENYKKALDELAAEIEPAK